LQIFLDYIIDSGKVLRHRIRLIFVKDPIEEVIHPDTMQPLHILTRNDGEFGTLDQKSLQEFVEDVIAPLSAIGTQVLYTAPSSLNSILGSYENQIGENNAI
jgi:hypothetical protein